MTTATQTTFRVIFKCRNKNCKHVWAFDYQAEGRHNGTRELKQGEQEVQEDRYTGGRRIYSVDVMGALRCPCCNINLPKGNRVEGHYSAKHICSAKCMSATGGVCECSCSGANHGANHL